MKHTTDEDVRRELAFATAVWFGIGATGMATCLIVLAALLRGGA